MVERRRLRRILYAAAAVAVLLGGGVLSFVLVERLGAPGSAPPALSAAASRDLERARAFDEFPLYWLGESFQGLPLTAVVWIEDPGAFPGKPWERPPAKVWIFDYGDCTIPPGRESCPIPLTIQIRPYCEVPPEIIADRVKTGPPLEVRGALVQRTGHSLRLWTSNVSIGIDAIDLNLLMEAAENLVRLNGGAPSSPDEPLGPPDDIDCPPIPGRLIR